MRILSPWLVLGAIGVAQEVPVPAFDHGSVKASYVVSLPDDYSRDRTWPLILDFHGAIAPSRKGAVVTRRRLWSAFVKQMPCIVVGLNSRTRSWNRVRGTKDDVHYAIHVLAEVREKYHIDPTRIYLAGFSSGSDFLCSGGLQQAGPFAASLVVCPGPANVVGLRSGALLKKRSHPFLFATGEEDYIRKAGAWQAFVALEKAGGRTRYREVPGVGHDFFPLDEYVRLFRELEELAGDVQVDRVARAREAAARGDELTASSFLVGLEHTDSSALRAAIRARGNALLAEAEGVSPIVDSGRAYETWWRLRTQYHRFPDLAAHAVKELAALEKEGRRELFRARRAYFRTRSRIAQLKRRPRTEKGGLFSFDCYLTYPQLSAHVADLARRFPEKVRVESIGKSIEGRDLWVIEITDRSTGAPETKPAVYAQGALHGNEISSMMNVLYFAWKLAANPEGERGIARLLTSTTFYLAPAVNPDGAHHYMTEPHSHWRPRFNYRPHDADGDGKVDEDPYEDLDGDGQIGLMYAPDPKGPYGLKDGKLSRGRDLKGYRLVAREGIDNDGDGKFSEDRPGGVDLNRNFPMGFKARKTFEGSRGAAPASEPETRAIVDFVQAHRNIALFLDYHNAASCVFYWLGPEPDDQDIAHYQAATARAKKTLGYAPKPLRHAGAGLSIAWAFGREGIPAFLIELEATLGPQAAYFKKAWRGDVFIAPKPFEHPQLGKILIGNDHKKIPKRNPHPADLVWQAERNWNWVRAEAERLPRLALENPRIERIDAGYEVSGEIVNTGESPVNTAMAATADKAFPITITAEGAETFGTQSVNGLAAGARIPFSVRLEQPGTAVTLLVSHPRAGTVRLAITRPRSETKPIRREYEIEPGYATPDQASAADNDFYEQGRSETERGPAFDLTLKTNKMRVGVLLGEWKDRRHTIDAAAFERAFFSKESYHGASPSGQPVYGSLRDFYDEMSYGRMEVTGQVFDWAELPGSWEKYRDASFGSRIVQQRMIEAVKKKYGADALDTFDGLAFLWAGNSVKRTSALWPMKLALKDFPNRAAFKMGEYHHGESAPIGVACHEMGHTFGVADKYGLGASANPLGPWCLMAKGTHGGAPSARHRPFHMCAWCKMVIGWVKPVVIDAAVKQRLALRPILYGPSECYRILLKPDGSEYLLLENRRREGFFTDLPAPGLAVLRVGPNDKPAFPQTRVQLLPAHGKPPLRRGFVADPAAIAWPQKARDELVVDSVRLSHIRLVDDVIYFEVSRVSAK